MDDGVTFDAPVAQRLGPVAGLLGQIGTGILGQSIFHADGVVRCEADADDAAPSGAQLRDLEADPLADHDGPVAEHDPLAVGLSSDSEEVIVVEEDVLAVRVVELQWRQVVVGRGRVARSPTVMMMAVSLAHDRDEELFHFGPGRQQVHVDSILFILSRQSVGFLKCLN